LVTGPVPAPFPATGRSAGNASAANAAPWQSAHYTTAVPAPLTGPVPFPAAGRSAGNASTAYAAPWQSVHYATAHPALVTGPAPFPGRSAGTPPTTSTNAAPLRSVHYAAAAAPAAAAVTDHAAVPGTSSSAGNASTANAAQSKSAHSTTAAPAASVTGPVPVSFPATGRSATKTASSANAAPSGRSKRKLTPSFRLSDDNDEGRYSAFRDSQTKARMKRVRSTSSTPPPSTVGDGVTPRHNLMLLPMSNSTKQKQAASVWSSASSQTITVTRHVLEAIPSDNFTAEEILTFPVAFSYFLPTISKNKDDSAPPRPNGMCKVPNCPKWRQGHCNGMCMGHYRESVLSNPPPPRLPTPPAHDGEEVPEAKPPVTDHSEATARAVSAAAPATSTEPTAPTPTSAHNSGASEARLPDSRPTDGAAEKPFFAPATGTEDMSEAVVTKPDDSMPQLVAGTSTSGAGPSLAAPECAPTPEARPDAFTAQTISTGDAVPTPVLTVTPALAETSRKEAAKRQKKWDKSMKSSVARFERRRAGGKNYSRSDRGAGRNDTGAATNTTNATSGGIGTRSRSRSTRTSAAAVASTNSSVTFSRAKPCGPPKEIYSGPAPSLPDGTALPDGWTVKIFERTGGTNHKDRYWFSPAAKKKLRSQVQVKSFLNNLNIVRGRNRSGGRNDSGEDGGNKAQPTESADVAQPRNETATETSAATVSIFADVGSSIQEEEEAWELCNIRKK